MKHWITLNFTGILWFTLVIFCCSFGFALHDLVTNQEQDKNTVANNTTFLLDDFSNTRGISVFGTQWRMFSDRVMGGLSTGFSGYEIIKGRQCLRLQGSVSLENNGGFIQVALSLLKGKDYFDASQFKGIRLWVLGNGETYHLHLRSSQSRRPWQYFGAPFKTNGEWRKIDISFQEFKPENLTAQLDTSRLTRIAIAAIKKKFKADIAIARLEFYN